MQGIVDNTEITVMYVYEPFSKLYAKNSLFKDIIKWKNLWDTVRKLF